MEDHPLEVRFGEDGTKNNNDNDDEEAVVARIERKHYCDPKLIASNTKEVLDKEGNVKAMVNELPKITIGMYLNERSSNTSIMNFIMF